MPDNRETGKDRWRRIPKDYFKRPDGLQRARFRLSVIALVVSAGWFAAGFDRSGRSGSTTDLNGLRANHGVLARAHSIWDDRCEACHVPFEPIGGRALLSSASTAETRSSDRLCISCHAGPAHHATSRAADDRACAECHRDHRGRDASLVRLADGDCTRCHEALHAHTDPDLKPKGGRDYAARILAFDPGNHPPFRSESADYADEERPVDRGKLKFNHALHMSPGLVRRPGDRPYTVGQIPTEADRERYGKVAAEAVRLDCTSCHLLDAGDGPPAGLGAIPPARSAGRYYFPASYQAQCRSCHPLTYDPRTPRLEAPHGVQPGEVALFLRRAYAEQLLSDNPKLLDDFRPKVSPPGRSRPGPTPRERLDEAVAAAEGFLFENSTNCKECHGYAGGIDHGVVPARIEPTNVPEVWFPHAAFDHSAHRGVSCRDCHARAFAVAEDGKTPIADASKSGADVLLPGIESCARCHAPARPAGAWFNSSPGSPGRASADCVECHKFHGGDRPSDGPGSRARDATLSRTIADYLEGTSPRAGSPASR